MLQLRVNESIEGWAPVTVISPQQGATVINFGHLAERHYDSAVQLDYCNDSIQQCYQCEQLLRGYNRLIYHGQK